MFFMNNISGACIGRDTARCICVNELNEREIKWI